MILCLSYSKQTYLIQRKYEVLISFTYMSTIRVSSELVQPWARVHQRVVKEMSVVNVGGLGRI